MRERKRRRPGRSPTSGRTIWGGGSPGGSPSQRPGRRPQGTGGGERGKITKRTQFRSGRRGNSILGKPKTNPNWGGVKRRVGASNGCGEAFGEGVVVDGDVLAGGGGPVEVLGHGLLAQGGDVVGSVEPGGDGPADAPVEGEAGGFPEFEAGAGAGGFGVVGDG